jgi:hypothetical protein
MTEQEPSLSDPDLDEEADLVLSLETETGLLTNQHTKGKKKKIDMAEMFQLLIRSEPSLDDVLIEFCHNFCLQTSQHRRRSHLRSYFLSATRFCFLRFSLQSFVEIGFI